MCDHHRVHEQGVNGVVGGVHHHPRHEGSWNYETVHRTCSAKVCEARHRRATSGINPINLYSGTLQFSIFGRFWLIQWVCIVEINQHLSYFFTVCKLIVGLKSWQHLKHCQSVTKSFIVTIPAALLSGSLWQDDEQRELRHQVLQDASRWSRLDRWLTLFKLRP